jgi:hypothetical protein
MQVFPPMKQAMNAVEPDSPGRDATEQVQRQSAVEADNRVGSPDFRPDIGDVLHGSARLKTRQTRTFRKVRIFMATFLSEWRRRRGTLGALCTRGSAADVVRGLRARQ